MKKEKEVQAEAKKLETEKARLAKEEEKQQAKLAKEGEKKLKEEMRLQRGCLHGVTL